MNDKPEADISEQEKVLATIRIKMGFSSETLNWFKEIQGEKETFVPLEIKNKPEKFPEHIKVKYADERKGLVCKGVLSNEERDDLLKLPLENKEYEAYYKEYEKYCGVIGALFEESQIWFVKEGGNLFFSKYKDTLKDILIKSIESIIGNYFTQLNLSSEKRPNIKVKIYDSNPELGLIIQIVQLIISAIVHKNEISEIFKETYNYLFNLWGNLKDTIKNVLNKRVNELLKSTIDEYKISDSYPPQEPIYTDFKIDFSPLWNLNQKDISGDISELIHLMFVGLMGAYKEVEKVLKDFHDKNNKPAHGFLFIESLVHQPLYESPACDDKSKKWVFSPFPYRLGRHSLFMSEEDITQQDILIQLDDSIFTQQMYERWKNENHKCPYLKFERFDEIIIDSKEVRKLFFAIVEGAIPNLLENGSSDFLANEFKPPLTIEILCKVINDDNYNVSLNATINTINWLNELLRVPNFYDILHAKKPDMGFPKNITELIDKTKDYRNKRFSDLNNTDQNNIKRCNRLLLEETYPRETPKRHAYSKYSLSILRNILKAIGSLQFDSQNKPMTSFFIPIASNQIFYGDLFICVPHFHDNGDSDKLKQLASKLLKCVNEHYVPALALIHEHFFEKLVARQIEKVMKKEDSTPEKKQNSCIEKLTGKYNLMFCLGQGPLIEYQSSICRRKENRKGSCYSCDYLGWEESSDNVVEKYLHKLWQDRKTKLTGEDIKESLFFKDYLYTDPKMLDILKSFLKPSKAKLKNLPSVLVVAPPGAGKEDIPKLIKLFTDYYNRGKMYKLNMASLKPDAIVPITIVGGVIKIKTTYTVEDIYYKLKGIFEKIREETDNEFQNFLSSIKDDGLYIRAKQYRIGLNSRIINTIREQKDESTKKHKKERELVKNLSKNLNDWLERNLKKKQLWDKIKEQEKALEELEREIQKLEDKKASLNENMVKDLKKKIENLYTNQEGLNDLCEEQIKELKKAIIKFTKNLRLEEKLLIKWLFGKFPTIVLDELNSMNIESQGVLLRFLENAEITPIGSCEDEMSAYGKEDKEYWKFLTDFLVVGVMNEDPEELTREEAIRFLKKESYIGGLLGDMLYEHMMKMRRLRSDLRARIMRNGKFEVPRLAKQRTNIPVIFYNIINKDKKDYFEDSKIRITMDALEYLMKPDLEWTENIRLLQTLTKKVMEVLYEDYEDYENKDKELIIVREKHIKQAMKEIGMIKEERLKEASV